MERKQFTFYASFAKALARIRDDSERAKAYDTIINYALFGVEPDMDSLSDTVALAFELIKPTLDSSSAKSHNGAKKSEEESNEIKTERNEIKTERSEAKRSEKKRSEIKTERTNTEKKRSLNEKEKEIEVEIDIENECYIPPNPPGGENKTRFRPPTVEEVSEYCLERKNGVDPQRFVDFYASKGWKVGNQGMKDWQAAVRTWERTESYGKKPEIESRTFSREALDDGGFDVEDFA